MIMLWTKYNLQGLQERELLKFFVVLVFVSLPVLIKILI